MKRPVRIVLIVIGVILGSTAAGALTLYLVTSPTHTVLPTVLDDPGLPSIELNGVRLHAETFGDSDHPVLIVVHGGPGDDYRSLLGLSQLADDYFVVFYDQRGAGLSERVPENQLSLQAYLEELDAVVDRYGKGDPVYIIGHSWGGMLLSGYVGIAPEKVSKAIMAEPGFLTAKERQDWMAYQKRFYNDVSFLWFALRTGFEAMHIQGPDKHAPDDYLFSEIVHYFTNHPENPYHCPGEPYGAPSWRFGSLASSVWRNAPDEDIDRLAAGGEVFTGPVLFLAGECNTWIGAELQESHTRLYDNATVAVIPDDGHDMFWDNPEKSTEVVRGFLGE